MAGVGEKMMVGAFTGLLSPLLGKLTKLMEEKYAQIKGVRKKVKSLQKELVSINVALEKHAEMERPDKQVKLWMNELREMAYDMEDCVDDFMYHVGVHHEPAGIKQFLQEQFHKLKTLSYRSKFAKQNQELKAEVDAACERYKQYKIDGSESSAKIDPRLSELHVEMKKLVGIEGPIEEIISRFNVNKTGPVNQHRVISIVGPGGSGKTTLAYQVYERIKDQFSCACFVSLSQKPNMRTILNDFLSKAGSSGSTSDSVQHLIERLRALLENKKYLIVIDDIWGTSDWNSIKSAFPENVHASRIITTRNKSIAEICCTSKEDFVYPMELLSRSDSRKLFLKRTFDAEDECPGQLEGIINVVLHKCGGLPLAIVTLASLFSTKQGTEEEWTRVLKSIRSIEGKDEKLEVMDWILALSYNDLPYHLKICLLSLSMFPEECEIDKYRLVWRWIAEGFVVSVGDCTFQEVGERYFNELINRSLIQPIIYTSRHIDGGVRACRVHDIVLDFIVSRSTEENFVNSILDDQYTPSQDGKIRRLYIRNKNGLALETSQRNVDLSHLRALNVFSAVTWMPPLSGKKFLRVLDLEGCDTLKDDDLKNIRSLIQLTYLGLRWTKIKNLPIQFNKLRFLQTLDIRRTEIRKLPQAIVELKRLVRLVGDELTLPDGFGKMEALEELGEIDVDSITVNFSKDLGDLTRLRKLAFVPSHALPQDTIVKPFMSPNSIRSLKIKGVHGDAEFFMDPWYSPPRLLQKFVLWSWGSNPVRFYRFPKWINSSLCNLTYLSLRVEHMRSTDMHMLQSLPALCGLSLTVHYISEEAGLSVSHDGFQQLTHLWFDNEYGTGLTFEAGAMRKLQKLFFRFDMAEANRKYGGIGLFCFGVQHLISLNHIEVVVYDRCLADDAESSEIWQQVFGNISNEIRLHPLPQNPKVDINLYLPSQKKVYRKEAS